MQKEEHPAVLAPSDLLPDSQPARSVRVSHFAKYDQTDKATELGMSNDEF